MRVPLFPRAIPTAFLFLATAASSLGDDTLRRRAAEVAAKTTLQVVPRPNAPEWGTSNQILHSIGFADFAPSASGMTFATSIGLYSTSTGVFNATPHRPITRGEMASSSRSRWACIFQTEGITPDPE